MPLCLDLVPLATESGEGVIAAGAPYSGLVVQNPQPSDFTTCTYVISSGADWVNNPFALTTEQGAQIGGAILLIWAVAWVIRTFAGMIHSPNPEKE